MLRPSTVRRALISVYDKTGIVEFARALHDEFGVEIISTGGTAKVLTEAGVPVTLVESITGFGELLDGRVKTLHPRIFAAILADRDDPEHMRQLAELGVAPIDMVVVNLYPFEKAVADPNCTFEQAIEMIDIGGVALLRAAAKNHRHVWAICVSGDESYAGVLVGLRGESGEVGDADRLQLKLAVRSFSATKAYDHRIRDYLIGCAWDVSSDNVRRFEPTKVLLLEKRAPARYGENPHQLAAIYRDDSRSRPRLALKHLRTDTPTSYNNALDADAALALCAELRRAAAQPWHRLLAGAAQANDATPTTGATETTGGAPTTGAPRIVGAPSTTRVPPANSRCSACCFIKHTNPCGVGVANDPLDAYRRAYLGDPNAAMGGVLACTFEVDAAFAIAVLETYDWLGKPLKDAGAPHAPGGFFVEVWLAPSFTADAVALIRGTDDPATAESRPTKLGGGEARIASPPRKKWGQTVRLLAVGDMSVEPDAGELQYRSIAGGMLVQTPDLLGLNEEQWRVVTKRAPTQRELADLRLAWLIAKHTRSNAISIVRDGMLFGNGAGQMSRVMSCRVASWLARENGHLLVRGQGVVNRQQGQARGDGVDGPVAASDAFFPFRDGPDILLDAGVTAIIQPGGSKRDDETIAACDERGAAMIFTGTRHFRH
jgi:phosphoribosylaminoimidazolecarboxamide formyltransferase/IMP cyclohydrolase